MIIAERLRTASCARENPIVHQISEERACGGIPGHQETEVVECSFLLYPATIGGLR